LISAPLALGAVDGASRCRSGRWAWSSRWARCWLLRAAGATPPWRAGRCGGTGGDSRYRRPRRGELLPYHPTIGQPYEPLPGGLWRRPGFVDPGYILLTVFDTARRRWVVQLLRLRDGQVVRTYARISPRSWRRSTFRSALIDLARDKTNQRFMAMHPMLMPDGGLIVHDTSPLVRIDACGRPEWMIDGIFHHSLERAPDGTLWASYRLPRTTRPALVRNLPTKV
jgi:hypothetical protein